MKIIYLIFVSLLIGAQERQSLRALYKNDQHSWLVSAPNQLPHCGICLQSDGKIHSLACHKSHRFHPDCIEKWKQEKSNCPICRAEIVDSVWCTCLKSVAKPSVILALAACSVSCIKSFESIDQYLALVEPTLQDQCGACTSFAISSTCALLMGGTIYLCTHPKDD